MLLTILLGLILKFKNPGSIAFISLKRLLSLLFFHYIFVEQLQLDFFIFLESRNAIFVDKSPNFLFLGSLH